MPDCSAQVVDVSEFVRVSVTLEFLRRRFGNPVVSSKGQAPFVLTSSGPGALKHSLREAGSGAAELEICATIVGAYNLSVT